MVVVTVAVVDVAVTVAAVGVVDVAVVVVAIAVVDVGGCSGHCSDRGRGWL